MKLNKHELKIYITISIGAILGSYYIINFELQRLITSIKLNYRILLFKLFNNSFLINNFLSNYFLYIFYLCRNIKLIIN
jgi:hypothetical protein